MIFRALGEVLNTFFQTLCLLGDLGHDVGTKKVNLSSSSMTATRYYNINPTPTEIHTQPTSLFSGLGTF